MKEQAPLRSRADCRLLKTGAHKKSQPTFRGRDVMR